MLKSFQTSASRRGSVAVLSVALLLVLLVMVAFAVDLGYLYCVRTQAQAVADAAALAGARGMTGSPAQVRTNAKACAVLNKVNNASVVLQDSDIVLGNWDPTAKTFTILTGAAEAGANACQVNVALTAARGNPVNLFFAKVIGKQSGDVTASATASGKRWDVIVAQDISASYAADLANAASGTQDLVDGFNQYSASSMFGVSQHTGWGSTWAPLQTVGTNYSLLRATCGNIKDAQSPTSGTAVNGGGPGITPPTSGSDLSTGIQTAINMFGATSYTSSVPPGTRQAIIVNSDGASNASNTGQHPSPTYSDTQLDALASAAADAAWAKGISVFVVLYYHSGDSAQDTAVLQSLVRGQGTFIQVTDPTQVPTALKSIFANNLSYGLVK